MAHSRKNRVEGKEKSVESVGGLADLLRTLPTVSETGERRAGDKISRRAGV